MINLIEVGKVVNTHGLKGEIKLIPWTDFPEVFDVIDSVYTNSENEFNVCGIKYQKNCVILKLKGIDKVEDAEKMRGLILYADKDIFSCLPDDTYLIADLTGMEVYEITNDNKECLLGKLTDVIQTGSNDIYTVQSDDGKILLLPAIKDVIINIDSKGKKITVKVPDGLKDI